VCVCVCVQDASVGESPSAGVRSSDQRQLTPDSSSPSASVVPHPLTVSVPQSQHWSDTQWTGGGQQTAVSLAPGSVLPINLLPAELSSVLGMAAIPSTVALSSATLPVSWLLPGGLLVSADNGNIQDPLANLSRLSTGLIPATSASSSLETGKMAGNANGPHTKGIKVEQAYNPGRQTNAVHVGTRPTLSVPELSQLAGRLETTYTPVKTEYLQQAGTVASQLPLAARPPHPVKSSSTLYSPALQQLLQQGTTHRSSPLAVPAYPRVPENSLPVGGGNPLQATVEVAPSSGRRRWTSADGAVWNRRSSCAADDDPAVNLLRQESSGFDISRTISSPGTDPVLHSGSGVEEFSAPSGPGLHHKFRRKHRPQPLIIPSPVGHFGFQSRLRSPRVCDQSSPQLTVDTSVASSLQVPPSAGLTPYTPPPMLSPVRTGSGLFCSLVQPSPKSAPVGFRLGLIRASK